MNKPTDLPVDAIDHDDIGTNDSPNPHFASVLDVRLSRRTMLRGGMASAATALFGSVGLSACGGGSSPDIIATAPSLKVTPKPDNRLLGFSAVDKSLLDRVIVPTGYTATVIYALGDPLTSATPAYRNDGTDTDFENRAGDHHDGMEWFGLSPDGRASSTSVDRGLLGINHEATTDEKLSSFFIHSDGGTMSLPRPAAEVDKEIALHGVSFVEVRRTAGQWAYVQNSLFNRRFTALSEMQLSGPARGNALMITKYSPAGTTTRGTINNCGTGKTPWGTFLTGEENWAGYFTRALGDDAARGNDKSVVALNRYGRREGSQSRHGWESAGAEDNYARWIVSKLGTSTDGSDDYRNELNGMGYIVEMDAYNKRKPAKKRTGLGRFSHESAAFGKVKNGQPLAVYMGDDSRNEYIYKFVSSARWRAEDANPVDCLAVGDKYLDSGTLYVARFNADGTGEWLALSMSNPAVAAFTDYPFADQADIAVHARLAGDAVGATKMDRPEWCSVNPANGEIYFALTNNSNRRVSPSNISQTAPDAANPRAYTDFKDAGTLQQGNVNGHILRIREAQPGSAATRFTWDVYVFGAESGAPNETVNLSSLTADQDFSSPDGLVFSPATGICWFQTDDGAYADVTNCMMLAGLPGEVGDGKKVTLTYPKADGSTLVVDTYVGKPPSEDRLKRFLVGPVDCEITGLAETPDGKAMFVNIQHPGEGTSAMDIGNPGSYTSQWPGNAGYGPGRRPRSATIVITKDDGGQIGT